MEAKTIKLLLLLISFGLAGCYYDVEEELYPVVSCETNGMSYTTDILPIIEANCYTCHRTGSTITSISLEGYDKLKTAALNGSLVGAIKHLQGYVAMPQSGAKLSDCNISKIEAWINDGIQNN